MSTNTTTRVLWQGHLDEVRLAEATISERHKEYRILLVPTSTRLWVEEKLLDRMGADAWRDLDGARATMVLETALVELAACTTGPRLLADVPYSGEPVPGPWGASAGVLHPEDALLPFKTGEYAGKKLSDLVGADFKKLVLGYRRAAMEALSEEAHVEKVTWLLHLKAWATYRAIELDFDLPSTVVKRPDGKA